MPSRSGQNKDSLLERKAIGRRSHRQEQPGAMEQKIRNKKARSIEFRHKKGVTTCILSSVKQIASPGWMHETSARGWCTGKTQRDGMGRGMGGGFRMGNTCKSMADSCQCMAKTTTTL